MAYLQAITGSAGAAPLDRICLWHATIHGSGNWMTLVLVVPEYVVLFPGSRRLLAETVDTFDIGLDTAAPCKIDSRPVQP